MSELLKEWLGSLVNRELSTFLLSAREKGRSGSKQRSTVIEKQDNEGARIAIDTETRKHPMMVQLLRFHSYKEPIRALVSDSEWTVVAEFRPAAVRSFEASHFRQRITRDTIGGLVHIQGNCELVVRLDSSTAASFLLVIHECQFRGSGGSPTYGRPKELASSSAAQEILQALFSNPGQLRSRVTSTSDSDAEAGSRPCTQSDLYSIGAKDTRESPKVCVSATQLSLSTQFPPIRSDAFRGSVGLRSMHAASIKGQKITSQLGHEEKVDALVRNRAVQSGGLLHLLKHRAQSECVPQTPYSLKPAKSMSRSSAGPSSVHRSSNQQADAARSTQVSQHQPLKDDQNRSVIPLPERKPSVARADVDYVRQGSSIMRRTESPSRGSVRATKKEARLVEDAKKPAKSTNNRKENQRQGQPTRRHSHQSPERDSLDKLTIKPVHTSFSSFVLSNDEDPWKGMTRIRKRESRISTDQQTLLDSNDCWYPPKLGSRGPVTNIPVKLLKRFSENAERHLHKTAPADEIKQPVRSKADLERQSSLESTSSGEERDTNDDDDSTHSTEIPWSPSPPRLARYNQLPPDSSALDSNPNDGGFRPPKGLVRTSVFDNIDDNLEDHPLSGIGRADKIERSISIGTSFEQEQKSSLPNMSRPSSPSKSLPSEKQSDQQASKTQLQKEGEENPLEESLTSHKNTSSAKTTNSQKSLPRVIDSGCDVDDSDMESCLPTALGDKVQDAPKADTPPPQQSCSGEKRKSRSNNDESTVPQKRIKFENLFTFNWERDKQWEDVSSNLHRLKENFYQQEVAKSVLSSSEQVSSSNSPATNHESVRSSSPPSINPPATRSEPVTPTSCSLDSIPSSNPGSVSLEPVYTLCFSAAISPTKERTPAKAHTADQASRHEPVLSSPSTQPVTSPGYPVSSSPSPSTKKRTDPTSSRSNENIPERTPSNERTPNSLGKLFQGCVSWISNPFQ